MKTKVMIKKKSNVRKYSRKVKNKKVKYSKKLMSGGGNPILSFTIPEPTKLTSTTNKKWKSSTQAKQSNIDIITKLHNLYDCNIIKTEEFENFEKYEYKKTDSNPKTRYLYRKINTNKEENEVFNVYELTNTIIGIEYNKDKVKDKLGKFYEISLIDLNVDLIQLAINTKSLYISKDPNDNNSYLGFTNNFPALVYNNDRTSFAYTSREQAKWTNVYEDNHFEKIDTFSITIKNDKYPHPSHTTEFSKKYNITNITNQELYVKKYSEIKDRLLSSNYSDIKDVLSQDIFRMRVKVECENDDSLTDLAKLDFIISQNISWVLKNALWLEKYLEIRTVNNSLTAQQLKSQIGEKYECDLSDLDEKYIIVDEKTIDGIKYVICGYPEKKMKEIILNFWQEGLEKRNETDINFCDELKKLHKLKETLKLLIDFYNYYNDDKINLDNLDDITHKKDLFKFYMKIESTFNNITKIFDSYYKENPTLKNESEYNKFKKTYLENSQNYYNEIVKRYFNKIMTTIRYIFIIFIKNKNNNLIPMIFNIKELEKNHILILERLNKLVKNELPYKFGIIEDEYKSEYKYNPISSYDNKEEYNSNNEYKLFYSSYKYGNFFHINTEYIHTMGNIYRKDYEYKQSITLEEIIYACSVNSEINSLLPYWKEVKINYNVREYGLSFPSPKQIESRSDIVYDKYEADIKSKEVLSDKKITINKSFDKIFDEIFNNKNLKNSKIKIIMIYKINIQSYKIILKYINTENIDEIYILEIESSISELIDNIIKNLYNNIILNKISKIITFNTSDIPKFFKVISIKLITKEDYNKIFAYNPFLIYYINQNKISISKEVLKNNKNEYNNAKIDIIDTSIYYVCALLNLDNTNRSYLINIYNVKLYKLYPSLVTTFLKDNYYIENQNLDNDKYCHSRLEYNKLGDINCVYYDYNQCGYDFIEYIDHKNNKLVIYIFPNKNKNFKYLGNITDLEESSKKMINELNTLYSNNQYNIFAHIILNTTFFCLHFHIIKTDYYNREKHFTQKGTYIIQDIFIKDIINNLNINSNYYKNSNYMIIKQR